MKYSYNHAVLGGTFDLLHLGHQSILSHAFKIGKFVTIGLTTDQFNKNRNKPSWQNQSLRLKNLKLYLQKKDLLKRSRIILIDDIFGTTLEDSKLQAIVVTKSNMNAVRIINQKRFKNNLKPLQMIIVPYLKDEEGKIISSTRIRDGQKDPFGRSYKSMLLKMAGKRLPNSVRNKLQKPLGQIMTMNEVNSDSSCISVGDVTTSSLLKARIKPVLAIIDGKIKRKEIATVRHNVGPRNDKRVVKVKNPAGQISKSLILAIDKALHPIRHPERSEGSILVSGEEDLATIPAILLAPLGTIVLYGQPGQGMVGVKVDLEIKDYLCQLLKL